MNIWHVCACSQIIDVTGHVKTKLPFLCPSRIFLLNTMCWLCVKNIASVAVLGFVLTTALWQKPHINPNTSLFYE